MPDQAITNPGAAFGQTVNPGKATTPLVNASTVTITANSIVQLSTAGGASPTPQQFTLATKALTNKNCIGVLDQDTVAGAIGDVCTKGYHLVAVSSSSPPARMSLLAVSTVLSQSTKSGKPTTCLLKAATAAAPGPGVIMGISLSTQLDSQLKSSTNLGRFIPAYIQKM